MPKKKKLPPGIYIKHVKKKLPDGHFSISPVAVDETGARIMPCADDDWTISGNELTGEIWAIKKDTFTRLPDEAIGEKRMENIRACYADDFASTCIGFKNRIQHGVNRGRWELREAIEFYVWPVEPGNEKVPGHLEAHSQCVNRAINDVMAAATEGKVTLYPIGERSFINVWDLVKYIATLDGQRHISFIDHRTLRIYRTIVAEGWIPDGYEPPKMGAVDKQPAGAPPITPARQNVTEDQLIAVQEAALACIDGAHFLTSAVWFEYHQCLQKISRQEPLVNAVDEFEEIIKRQLRELTERRNRLNGLLTDEMRLAVANEKSISWGKMTFSSHHETAITIANLIENLCDSDLPPWAADVFEGEAFPEAAKWTPEKRHEWNGRFVERIKETAFTDFEKYKAEIRIECRKAIDRLGPATTAPAVDRQPEGTSEIRAPTAPAAEKQPAKQSTEDQKRRYAGGRPREHDITEVETFWNNLMSNHVPKGDAIKMTLTEFNMSDRTLRNYRRIFSAQTS